MTPRDALIELLERVGAQHGAAVLISEAELQRWPPEAVSALRAHQFLTRARPASTVVCPGCEEHCVMPVETIPGGPSGPAQFIVCDKDIDINRVDITPDQLRQWKCDAAAIARFVARCLGLHRSGRRPARSGILEIGLAAGDTRCQMLCLRTDGDATLVVSDATVPLAELVDFDGDAYTLDTDTIRQLVDSATTADPRYTPSTDRREARKLDTEAKYESWGEAYRALKQRRPHMSDVWYAGQIARQEVAAGCSAETIRKHMKG